MNGLYKLHASVLSIMSLFVIELGSNILHIMVLRLLPWFDLTQHHCSPQNSGSSATSTPSAPVTGYKRMVIPTQPPLTATKKSTPKAQTGGVSATSPSSASSVAKPQSFTPPQPVPASYATASTPSQPTFNVQVRSAQPGPQHQAPGGHGYGQQPVRSPAQVQYMPAQPRGPDFAYGPPQPGFSPMSHGGYQEHHQPGIPQGGVMSSRRPEPLPPQQYQPPGPKKTYITDVPPSLAPYNSGPTIPLKVRILFFKILNELTLIRSASYVCPLTFHLGSWIKKRKGISLRVTLLEIHFLSHKPLPDYHSTLRGHLWVW